MADTAIALPHSGDSIVLVDERDGCVGFAEKQAVHMAGRLHRALSVFVFNPRGALLLQRRAVAKYHSGGLWSNTCCGHPRPGEDIGTAAKRRLREEMGFCCALVRLFSFIYRAELGRGLIEHEYDHVLLGYFDAVPNPEPKEVGDWRWMEPHELILDLRVRPEQYTVWFRLAAPLVLSRTTGDRDHLSSVGRRGRPEHRGRLTGEVTPEVR